MISVIITVKNREMWRIKTCLKFLYKADEDYGLIDEVILVDYGSKKPIKISKRSFPVGKDINQAPDIQVIRVEAEKFNKCHAQNVGILKSTNQWIMCLDVDMLLDEMHMRQIASNLHINNFMINTNVRKIEPKQIVDTYQLMVNESKPWYLFDGTNQLHNLANGGIQIFPRWFYDRINGFPEGLAVYWGGEDNWVVYVARLNGMNILDLSYPFLHVNHKIVNQEGEIAKEFINFKNRWLNMIIKNKWTHNPEPFYGRKKPCTQIFDKFLKEYCDTNNLIEAAIRKGEREVEINLQKYKLDKAKPSVIICVISNKGSMPDYFVWDLIKLFSYTRQFYECDIQQVNSTDVGLMRNLAMKFSLGDNPAKKRYDYVVQLDTDHLYPQDFVCKFIELCEENKWDVITGMTNSRLGKHLPTQFKELKYPISVPNNLIKNKAKGIIEIGASGPVGMVIRTKILEDMQLPYYKQEYVFDEKTKQTTTIGEDLYFCQKLKDKGIKIHLDCDVSFPHNVGDYFADRGRVVQK